MKERNLVEAIDFANKAASLTVQKSAQASIPLAEEVQLYMINPIQLVSVRMGFFSTKDKSSLW